MPTFELRESYYGERGYRQYAVYKDGVGYHIQKKCNLYLDDKIIVDNEEWTIEDIMFSIEIYYYKCLENLCSKITTEEFIIIFNLYQENFNDLYNRLANIYKTNELLVNDIDDKLNILFSKDIKEIIPDAKAIDMVKICNNDINLELILLDLYELSLSQINKTIISITIDTANEFVVLHENRTIEYLTNNAIIESMYVSDSLMSDIRMLYVDIINLHKEELCKEKIKELCECLHICKHCHK